MTRSALIATQTRQHPRRGLLPRLQGDGLQEVIEVGAGWIQLPGRPEPLKRPRVGKWGENGYRPTPISHLDRLTRLHAPEQLTCPLPQLPHPDADHVLFVAQHGILPDSLALPRGGAEPPAGSARRADLASHACRRARHSGRRFCAV